MKIRFSGSIVAVVTVLGVASALAAGAGFRWGGPGYDPALKDSELSSRFLARPHPQDPSLVEILVDAEITVKGTAMIELVPKRGGVLKSDLCWKAMRHLTSPWACSFTREDLLKIKGNGQLRVKDKKGKVILKDKIDFDAVIEGLSAPRGGT